MLDTRAAPCCRSSLVCSCDAPVVMSSVWPLHESNLVCGDVRQRLFVHTMYSSNVWVPGCVCGLLVGLFAVLLREAQCHANALAMCIIFVHAGWFLGQDLVVQLQQGSHTGGSFVPEWSTLPCRMFDSWVPTSAFFPYTRPLTLLEPRSPATQSLDRAVAQGATTAW